MILHLKRIDFQVILTIIIETVLIRCYGQDFLGNTFFVFSLLILWFILAIFKRHPRKLEYKYISLCVFLLFIVFVCTFYGSLSNGIGNSLRYISLFFGAFVYSFYKDEIEKLRIVFSASVIVYAYFVIKSIIYYSLHPNIARLIISHHTGDYSQVALGGAYGLAFGAALLMVFIFIVLLCYWRSVGIIQRVIGFLSIALLCVLCIQIESTITLVGAIGGMTISLLFFIGNRGKNSFSRILFLMVMLLLVFIIIYLFKDTFANWLLSININKSEDITDRIHELAYSLKTDSISGVALEGRINYYQKAIDFIGKHPFLGSVFYNGYPTQEGLSGHSELLDVFALYGPIAGIPFCIWYFSNMSINLPISRYGYYVTVFVLLFFNQFVYTSGAFAFFFIIPAAVLLLNEHVANNKKIEV